MSNAAADCALARAARIAEERETLTLRGLAAADLLPANRVAAIDVANAALIARLYPAAR